MTAIDRFLDEMAADLRQRLALLDDDADRAAMEDRIALLTDYRLGGMDVAAFERLLAALRSGRSPVALRVLRPQAVAQDLALDWARYGAAVAV